MSWSSRPSPRAGSSSTPRSTLSGSASRSIWRRVVHHRPYDAIQHHAPGARGGPAVRGTLGRPLRARWTARRGSRPASPSTTSSIAASSPAPATRATPAASARCSPWRSIRPSLPGRSTAPKSSPWGSRSRSEGASRSRSRPASAGGNAGTRNERPRRLAAGTATVSGGRGPEIPPGGSEVGLRHQRRPVPPHPWLQPLGRPRGLPLRPPGTSS